MAHPPRTLGAANNCMLNGRTESREGAQELPAPTARVANSCSNGRNKLLPNNLKECHRLRAAYTPPKNPTQHRSHATQKR